MKTNLLKKKNEVNEGINKLLVYDKKNIASLLILSASTSNLIDLVQAKRTNKNSSEIERNIFYIELTTKTNSNSNKQFRTFNSY